MLSERRHGVRGMVHQKSMASIKWLNVYRNLSDCVGDKGNAWFRRPIGYCGGIWRRDGYGSLLLYFLSVDCREEEKKRKDIMHYFNCSRAHSIFIDLREEELLSSTRKIQAQLLQLEIATRPRLGSLFLQFVNLQMLL